MQHQLRTAGLFSPALLPTAAQMAPITSQAALMDAGPLTWLGTVEELPEFGKGKLWRAA
jgi:hypothetical protein